MPTIEALAAESLLFTNLNTYAVCSPTRASLLTGHHGIENWCKSALEAGRATSIQVGRVSKEKLKELSDGSITSAIFGKWHLMARNTEVTHPK